MMRRILIAIVGTALLAGLSIPPVGAARPDTDVETTWTGQIEISYWYIGPNPFTPAGWYAERIVFSGETAKVPGLGRMSFEGFTTAFVFPGQDAGELTLTANGGSLITRTSALAAAAEVTLDWAPLGNAGTTGRFGRVWPGTQGGSDGSSLRIFAPSSEQSPPLPPLRVDTTDPSSSPPPAGPYAVTTGTFTLHLEYL